MGQLDLLGLMFACTCMYLPTRFFLIVLYKGFCSALRLEWLLVARYDDLLPPAQLHQLHQPTMGSSVFPGFSCAAFNRGTCAGWRSCPGQTETSWISSWQDSEFVSFQCCSLQCHTCCCTLGLGRKIVRFTWKKPYRPAAFGRFLARCNH